MIPTYDGTILLVEDDDALRASLSRALRVSGYFVHEHPSGESALEFVRAHAGPIDLLVTDTMLPGMSGVETALAIRALRPGLPVLRMSGHRWLPAADAARAAGWHFLAKPFRRERLVATIRSIIGSPALGDPVPAA